MAHAVDSHNDYTPRVSPTHADLPSERHVSCPHAEQCPGCPWIAERYDDQLRHKADRVRKALQGFSELAQIQVSEVCRPQRIEGYRLRAKLVANARGSLGLFARGSHDVVDLPGCRVLDPAVQRAAQAVREGLFFRPVLDGVDIAHASEGVVVTLIAASDVPSSELRAFCAELLARESAIASVAVSRRRAGSVQLLGGDHEVLYGPSELSSRLAPEAPRVYVAHGAFMQAHAETARAIYSRIVEHVFREHPSKPRVLELYAGSGALSLWLATRGAQVTAVEAFPPACERLERAAREQELMVQVRNGDASREAWQLAERGTKLDAVVVNPPRRGLDREVRRALVALDPEHIAYVSCEPRTLARDLAHLAREGFAPRVLEPYDMMPLTEHVETLAFLSRAAIPAPELVYRDDALIAVIKAPHEPTTPQHEHARSLLARVQALDGCERAVPLHRLDVGTSGLVLFARTPEQAGELARALADAEKVYTALAKGVLRAHGRVQRPIIDQGKQLAASTRYRRLEVVSGHSLLRVQLETGRKHQIRKHLASLGHPVIGDTRYGDRATSTYFVMRHGLDRPFLHCSELTLQRAGKTLELRAPLAPDLALVLDSMRGDQPSTREA